MNENSVMQNNANNNYQNNGMKCPRCGSNNTNIQIINESHLVTKHHGCLWWLFFGWYWILIKWLVLTVPALICKIFGIGKRQKIKNKTYKTVVCQNCGYNWKI